MAYIRKKEHICGLSYYGQEFETRIFLPKSPFRAHSIICWIQIWLQQHLTMMKINENVIVETNHVGSDALVSGSKKY